MSDRLLEVLTKLSNASQDFATQYQYPRVAPGRFGPPHTLVQELIKELGSVPEIAKWEGQRFSTYNAEQEINLPSLAGGLAERVINGVAPATAVNDLIDLLLNRKADIQVIMGVIGLKVTDTVELSQGVRIMPPSKLPPSKVREEMFDLDRDGRVQHRGRFLSDTPPNAALVIDGQMTVVRRKDYNPSERKELVDLIVFKQTRALASLTLSGPASAPFVTCSSSWVAHPAYPYSGFGMLGYGRWQGLSPLQPGEIDAESARALYAKVEALKEADWQAVMRATERLQRSRSHLAEADRAIDLGIALEMTLLHEIDR